MRRQWNLRLALFLVLTALPGIARADKYWVGTGAGNWSDPANWSDTAGGPGGAGVPQLGEAVSLWTTDAGHQGIILDVSANLTTLGIAATHRDGTVDFQHLSGSDLQTTLTTVGRYYGKTFYHQYGGSHSTGFLDIATTSSDDATYAISGGTLSTSRMDIGYSGSGTFLHSGGTVNVGTMQLARGHAYSGGGTYVMNGAGASLIVAGNETISYRSHGYFYQSAGNHSVGNALYVGSFNGGEAIFEMSGGSLTVGSLLAVGVGSANGTFIQSGGTVVAGNLDMGILYGAAGYYELNDPTAKLIVTGNERVVGTATFIHSSGYHFIGGTFMMSGSTYQMTGGTLELGGTQLFWGDFDQLGGTVKTTSLDAKHAMYTDYTLNAGTYTAPTLQPYRFIWNGGALEVGTLHLSGSMTVSLDGERTLVVDGLVDPGNPISKIDLTNNNMVIDYPWGASSDLTAIRDYLHDGKIRSSTADPAHRLGYADNADPLLQKSTFSGETFPAGDFTQLLIMYTIGGDANLDGKVNLIDLTALATHWQSADAFWTEGDFNYDGVVNAADLGILAASWQAEQLNLASAVEEAGLPVSAIPEPGVAAGGCAALMTVVLGRRRSRNHA